MDSVPVDYLAGRLESGNMEGVLILDTRPFMHYNESHVQGSVNVHLPPIVKRRSGGFVALENIVPSKAEREALQQGKYAQVIAYDQNTVDLCSADEDSNLYVIMQSLKQQVELVSVVYMTGGLAAFEKSHPGFTDAPGMWSKVKSRTLLDESPIAISRNAGPVEILPHLFLGDAGHASNRELLKQSSVTAILNASTNCEDHFEDDFRYMRIPVQDNSSADLLSWFPSAIAFIESVRINGGRVLVHCHAGISRSATICLAYLMSTKSLGLDAAYDHVRRRRSVIDPNLNFMRQLQDFENQLCVGTKRRRGSQDCSPVTPSSFSWPLQAFTFPVGSPCTPLVSPS